jgi:putative membrane protein
MAAQMRPALILPLGIFYSQHLVGLSLLSLIPASMVMVLAFPAHERKVRSFWLIVLILSLLVVWSLPFFS